MDNPRLNLAIAKLALSQLSADDMRQLAVPLLQDGLDTPSLWLLAGLTRAETDEAPALFASMLSELQVSVPNENDAAITVSLNIARQILDGTVTPIEGADLMYDRTYKPYSWVRNKDGFRETFYGLSLDWWSCPTIRDKIDLDIIESATKHLQRFSNADTTRGHQSPASTT